MNNAAFSIKQMRAFYGMKEVIKGVDISIMPNTVTALMAPPDAERALLSVRLTGSMI